MGITICRPGAACNPPPVYTPPLLPPPRPPLPIGVPQLNTNFVGNDIQFFMFNASSTKADCEAKCTATAECVAFTFAPAKECGGAMCWTKNGVTPEPWNCFISEVLKRPAA